MGSKGLSFGDFCRINDGHTPARYLFDGYGVGVCSQDNELMMGRAVDEERRPLPSDEELSGASAGLRYGMLLGKRRD